MAKSHNTKTIPNDAKIKYYRMFKTILTFSNTKNDWNIRKSAQKEKIDALITISLMETCWFTDVLNFESTPPIFNMYDLLTLYSL